MDERNYRNISLMEVVAIYFFNSTALQFSRGGMFILLVVNQINKLYNDFATHVLETAIRRAAVANID
jgi:hypothetical protein